LLPTGRDKNDKTVLEFLSGIKPEMKNHDEEEATILTKLFLSPKLK
jgi:hypothetical protein